MKGFLTVISASGLLSASLVAGLAATGAARSNGPRAEQEAAAAGSVSRIERPAKTASMLESTTWVDPPAKADADCRKAGWPYRPAFCAVSGQARNHGGLARKVRVISADGRRVSDAAASNTPSVL